MVWWVLGWVLLGRTEIIVPFGLGTSKKLLHHSNISLTLSGTRIGYSWSQSNPLLNGSWSICAMLLGGAFYNLQWKCAFEAYYSRKYSIKNKYFLCYFSSLYHICSSSRTYRKIIHGLVLIALSWLIFEFLFVLDLSRYNCSLACLLLCSTSYAWQLTLRSCNLSQFSIFCDLFVLCMHLGSMVLNILIGIKLP